MITNKSDFLNKELVKTLSYTTASQNREAYSNEVINGRNYTKYGTLQAVTFVGNLYKINEYKNVLVIGMSRQHPTDVKIVKELGYEQANINALNDPIIMIETQGKFTKRRFVDIVETYLSYMKLEFVKTRKEIELDNYIFNICL